MEMMSTVNLLILGLLLDKPMSAYEMAQLVETQIIGRLVKVSAPAIYKNIKRLHEDGYCTVETVKEGEMPEKKIYSVTETGKAYFLKLLGYYATNLQDISFDFNVFLLNLNKVDKQTGLAMLEQAKTKLAQIKDWVLQHEQEARARNVFFAGRAIIKQYRMIITTLINWLEEVIAEYRNEGELGTYDINSPTVRRPAHR